MNPMALVRDSKQIICLNNVLCMRVRSSWHTSPRPSNSLQEHSEQRPKPSLAVPPRVTIETPSTQSTLQESLVMFTASSVATIYSTAVVSFSVLVELAQDASIIQQMAMANYNGLNFMYFNWMLVSF